LHSENGIGLGAKSGVKPENCENGMFFSLKSSDYFFCLRSGPVSKGLFLMVFGLFNFETLRIYRNLGLGRAG